LLFRRKRKPGDFNEEIEAHLRLDMERLQEQGLSKEDAAAAARRAFGNVTKTQERFYESTPWLWWQRLWQDVWFSLRMLRRNPGFAVVAVLTLALGIGANTAIFSILDPLLLRNLPVSHPEELVRMDAAGSLGNIGAWEDFAYERFRDNSPVFSGVLAFVPVPLDDVAYNGKSSSASAEVVSENYFTVLGLRPFAGRLITAKQELGHAVVLGFDYWQREFSADTTVVGRTMVVQGKPHTIIGITPPEFFGMRVGEAADFYLPVPPGRAPAGSHAPSLDWVEIIGRLKPGVSLTQALSALQPTMEQIKAESGVPQIEIHQAMDHLVLTSAARGLSALRSRFSLPARILMCVVGLVLLIACSNVANLLLAQGAARRREITVRLALGAQRSRLVRQLLTESAVLAAAGALGGVLVAHWASRLLVASLSDSRTHVTLAASLNGRVLLFSLATTLLAVLLCGLAPAFSATRVDMSHDIKTYAADRRHGMQARLGSLLVVGQVAMSVTVLVAGGLLLHSLLNLETMDVGFDREHIIALDMSGNAKRTPEQVKNFYDQLLEKAGALPGVRSATMSSFAPVSDRVIGINLRAADGYTARPGEEMKVFLVGVQPGYFSTLGIGLLQGRDFVAQDAPSKPQVSSVPRVIIINRSLARHYFGDQDPIGKRLHTVEGNGTWEIVGVVADSKYLSLREDATDFVYLGMGTPSAVRNTLNVRVAGSVAELRNTLPELIQSLDSSVRVKRIATLQERIDDSLHADRLISVLCGTFSLLALTLTCVGLYGVLSFSVARKTSEIGIRMALGAEPGNIFRLFVGRGMRLVMAGLAVGLAGALASASLLKSLLFGVGRGDPITYLGICVLLALAAFAACFLPARRATRVDPLVALRNE
jgi:predicted permease